MSEEGEGFLARWSRRKRAAAAAPPPPASPPAAAPAPPVAEAKPAFDPASLPPVESLTADSDFAAFLREEVPAALKRAALRRAWALDPAIRDFVGPADYAWDYNAPGGVPGFSLEAPENLERLIAQAIGSSPPSAAAAAAEKGEPQEEEPPPRAEAAAAPAAEPPPPENPPQPDTPLAELEAPVDAPAPGTLPAAAVGPTAEPQPVVRRRHGGAVPS